jgi:hypothetical protein
LESEAEKASSMLQELACVDNREEFGLWRESLGRDSLRDLVHAAVLAANAQNAQPWRFELSEGVIDVHADPARHLGSFDPFRREMYQSIGCAIENLVQAASAQGLQARVETFTAPLPPPPDETLASRVRLEPAAQGSSELFDAIPRRRTNRGAYDTTRAIPDSVGEELVSLVEDSRLQVTLVEPKRQAALGDLIVQATRWIVEDWEMAADNAKWFRFLYCDVSSRDGLTLGANIPSRFVAAASRLFPPSDRMANKSWIGSTQTQVNTAGMLGAILAQDPHERAQAIEVGRLWQRLHLLLTARGLAAQPLNQPLERVDRERQLRLAPRAIEALGEIIGEETLQPAFLFRLGYPTREACLTPRRRLEDVIAGASAAPKARGLPWRWLNPAET